MKLVLFDVDGILVRTGSVKFDYWKAISKKHFGFDVDRHDIYTEGKTDREILFEHIQKNGIADPEKDKRFEVAIGDIGNIVSQAIKGKKIEQIPNVENLVKKLISEGFAVGLLTGNTQEKAKAKLESAGLWKYFKVCAFGDATRKRSELVSITLRDAKQKLGIEFKKEDVYLIGDTVRDIICAKEAGVKSIAVASGAESLDMLEKEKQDYLFKDFKDIDAIVRVIKAGNCIT